MKIVLSFKYNNKIFYILEYKNKYRVAWLNNGKLNFNLSIDEQQMVNSVIDSLTLSGKFLSVTPLSMNNTVYNVYYDKCKDLFFSDTKEENVIEFINKTLNNRNEFLSSGKVKNSKFKRIVKVGKTTLIVYLVATTSFLNLTNIKTSLEEQFSSSYTYEIDYETKDIEEDELAQVQIEDTKDVEENSIVDAISNNSNLTDEEKEIILSSSIFSDNYEYMDTELITKKLSTLKIEYVSDSNYAVGGEYSSLKNKIVIYNAESIDDIRNTYIFYTFTHEFCHTLTASYNDSNRFLIETTNSIFNDEYYGDSTNYDLGYLELKQITKALIEVTGSEPFREYQFNGDSSYIENALMEIMDSEIKADSLLSNMEQYHNYYVSLANGNLTDEELETIQNNKESVKNAIIDIIKDYYLVKYGIDAESDLVMLRYLDFNAFKEALNLTDEDSVLIDKDKYYFNSEKLNDTIVVSINNSEVLEINNENRYINNELGR